MRIWSIRLSAVALLVCAAWYTPWLLANMDMSVPWLALPFALSSLLVLFNMIVTIVCNWWPRTAPPARVVPPGEEPCVAVLIPTSGEGPHLVGATVRSVLDQDWPGSGMVVVVSDDAHSPETRELVERQAAHPAGATVVYHEPPPYDAPERKGEAKAGNLNSALDLVMRRWPEIEFVETRDADDLVGDRFFLRACLGQLLHDPGVAFVQTIKEARVSAGDPFDNQQALFFRVGMLARQAGNAVFPCGSGVVWRRRALEHIGWFPSWNLVEDLQSGVEALRRGWRGIYLPIVGAIGQHAPEDIPNLYKQRGTWALDTIRLLLWGQLKGLSFRQRLHFIEPGLIYLQSFAWFVFIACPVLGFVFDLYPLDATLWEYVVHLLPYTVALELMLVAILHPYPYAWIWKARQMWLGLMPVYMKACVQALLGGRYRKPAYRVTRKYDRVAWYWREVSFQFVLLVLLLGSVVYAIAAARELHGFDVGSMYWAAFFGLLLASFLPKCWHGVGWRQRLAASAHVVTRPVGSAGPLLVGTYGIGGGTLALAVASRGTSVEIGTAGMLVLGLGVLATTFAAVLLRTRTTASPALALTLLGASTSSLAGVALIA